MPRNFGVTVDDSRFESFIDSADKLQRLQVRVGILSGKPKYPAGWVGAKSRVKDTFDRFAALSANANNPDRERTMLGAYRALKKKAPGFSRRARKKRVAVAKVAAVVGLEVREGTDKQGRKKPKGERPKIPGLWIEATDRNGPFLQQQSAEAMRLSLLGQSPKPPIVRFGERLRMAFVAAVIREGHVDTRRLISTINWEITDLRREKFLRRQVTAMNKAKKLQREARKKAKL
jgi:hypothetical protein